VRQLFDEFLNMVRQNGPVQVIPQKTRIALQVRMRFASLIPRSTLLRGHLVLAERQGPPCFLKVDNSTARSHDHRFRIDSAEQLADEFAHWEREYHEVGCQEHLRVDGR